MSETFRVFSSALVPPRATLKVPSGLLVKTIRAAI